MVTEGESRERKVPPHYGFGSPGVRAAVVGAAAAAVAVAVVVLDPPPRRAQAAFEEWLGRVADRLSGPAPVPEAPVLRVTTPGTGPVVLSGATRPREVLRLLELAREGRFFDRPGTSGKAWPVVSVAVTTRETTFETTLAEDDVRSTPSGQVFLTLLPGFAVHGRTGGPLPGTAEARPETPNSTGAR